MSRSRTHTDLGLIRLVLDYADEHTGYAAWKQYGVHPKTVLRWQRRRETEAPGWPTDEDIAAWREDEAANGRARQANAARSGEYRKRVYLNRGNLQVPSLGTARRLQALFALGHTTIDMADELGVTYARVSHLMRQKFPVLNPATVEAVNAMYEKLHMVTPIDVSPAGRGHIYVHRRAARMAAKRGYHPPLAWDDIDDPKERPAKIRDAWRIPVEEYDEAVVLRLLDLRTPPRSTRADREEAMRRWVKAGNPQATLNDVHGWNTGRYSARVEGNVQEAS